MVPGNFPIGCVPLYLVRFETNDKSKYDELQCLKDYNDFSKYHNELLIRAIQELQQEHPNVAIVYGDYYYALTWVIKHAPRLGKTPFFTNYVDYERGKNKRLVLNLFSFFVYVN